MKHILLFILISFFSPTVSKHESIIASTNPKLFTSKVTFHIEEEKTSFLYIADINKNAFNQDVSKKKNQFDSIDRLAINIPKSKTKSIKKIGQYILTCTHSDLEKARFIYTWIAKNIKYDDKAYNKRKYGDVSARAVLKSKKSVCAGYSNLFYELCREVNLPVKIISGYSKGYSYSKNRKLTKPNHAWNAVKINGQWKLIDVTWGAGYGITVNKKLKAIKEFDSYWFCTPACEFIYKHLPENPKYQYLNKSISKKRFNQLPKVSNHLFLLGFPNKRMLRSILSKGIKPPEAWNTSSNLKILNAPLNGTIDKGSSCSFKVKCEKGIKIAIINNNQWTYLEYKNGFYVADFTPMPGQLNLSYLKKGSVNTYQTILTYRVKQNMDI